MNASFQQRLADLKLWIDRNSSIYRLTGRTKQEWKSVAKQFLPDRWGRVLKVMHSLSAVVPELLARRSKEDFRRLLVLVDLLGRQKRNGGVDILLCVSDWLAEKPQAIYDLYYFAAQENTLSPMIERSLAILTKDLPFAKLQSESHIRELYLAELFGGIEKVSVPIGAINEETGHENHTDLLYVAAMAKHVNAKRIFEFGTYMGRTTYHLASTSDDAHVVTLNLPPEEDKRIGPFLQYFFRNTPEALRIEQIFCDSRKFDTTSYRQSIDFVFIDADHSYEGVKNDTIKALEMLRPGGIIVWHDYAAKSPGVVQFMKELTETRPVFRIRKTCLAVYIDATDVYTFEPKPMPLSLAKMYQSKKSA